MKHSDNPLDHTTFLTHFEGMGYVLKEVNEVDETLNTEEDTEYLIFVGTHHDLQLYQIWYSQENPGIRLDHVSAFVPIVRRVKILPETGS